MNYQSLHCIVICDTVNKLWWIIQKIYVLSFLVWSQFLGYKVKVFAIHLIILMIIHIKLISYVGLLSIISHQKCSKNKINYDVSFIILMIIWARWFVENSKIIFKNCSNEKNCDVGKKYTCHVFIGSSTRKILATIECGQK